MNELEKLRTEIDRLDSEIVRLLNERARIAIDVGRVKEKNGSESFYSPEREQRIFDRLGRNNAGPFPTPALKTVYREILSASLSLERPLPVAYFGPAGTFTHQAAVRAFGSSANLLPVAEIRDVFDAVDRGEAQYGVVPVENSTEGAVTYTHDEFIDSELRISAEVLLPISLHLLSLSGRREEIRRIYSFPQPTAQCRRWLEKKMQGIAVVEVASTAVAAEMAAGNPDGAAIAGEAAAARYGLKTVERNIQDRSDNVTRFLVISRTMPHRTGRDRTSVLFSIKDRVGGLLNILRPFSEHGLNLSRIQSRPSRGQVWEYIFFIDFSGHVEDENVTRALEAVRSECQFLKILGSYPLAEIPAP